MPVLSLHSADSENVALVPWALGAWLTPHQHWGGEGVLAGALQGEHSNYPVGSWIRSPHLSRHTPWSDEGCLICVKTVHLTMHEVA